MVVLTTILVGLLFADDFFTPEPEPRFIEMPIATSVSRAEHDEQLAALRRFAGTLNHGGIKFDDLVIVGIRDQYIPGSYRRVHIDTGWVRSPRFSVGFMRAEDITDDIFSEMLAYTGIDDVDISMTVWIQPNRLFYDYLLENQAIRTLAEPHLRLRSFARRINSNTTYYHELTITSIQDYALIYYEYYWAIAEGILLGESLPNRFSVQTISVDGSSELPPHRFLVGLANQAHLEDEALIQEILHYIGLEADDVIFSHFPIDIHYTSEVRRDFLLVNAEIYKLYNQYKRINEFLDMHPHISASVDPASRGHASPISMIIRFRDERYLPDEELFTNMLDFAGVERDEIRAFVHRSSGNFFPVFQ